jgi:hypothetical protein
MKFVTLEGLSDAISQQPHPSNPTPALPKQGGSRIVVYTSTLLPPTWARDRIAAYEITVPSLFGEG